LSVVAANAIMLLVKAGVNFNGEDLRKINIRGADLSYGVFDRVDFTGADLRDVNFVGAYLRQAKFNGCQMNGVVFGKQSSLIHKDVNYICCSPDGKLLASAGEDKIIRLWQIENKQCLKILLGHTDRIVDVNFSHCGKLLISASPDASIRIWDITAGKCIKRLECFGSAVWHVRFSLDSKQFISLSHDDKLRLWDVATGTCIDTITNNANSGCNFEFSPNGEYLVWADNKLRKQAVLWEIKTKRVLRVLNEHQRAIKQVTFSPDSLCVITGSDDSTMRLWDIAYGHCIRIFVGHHRYIDKLCFSSDGQWIISASKSDKIICLWRVETGQCHKIFNEKSGSWSMRLLSYQQSFLLINCPLDDEITFWEFNPYLDSTNDSSSSVMTKVKLSHDNRCIVSTNENSAIDLWELTDGKHTKTFVKHDNKIECARLSSKDSSLALFDEVDKTIKIWDIPSGKKLINFSISHISKESTVQFSPNLQWVAFSSNAYSHQTVILRKISLGDTNVEITLRGHTGEIKQIEFSANSQYLATASTSDKTVRVWDLSKKTQVIRIDKFPFMFGIIKFSPDEKLLAAVTEENDYVVQVLDILTQEVLIKINSTKPNYPFQGLEFSFNNHWVAMTDCKNVQLWDITSRKCLAILKCKYSRKVYFSPDNQWLLAARDGGEVWWWDTERKFLRGIIYAYSGDICDINFSSDGRSLVIGSENAIQVWEWEVNDLKLEFKLKWSSRQKTLCLKDITFNGAAGLTEVQLDLFKQRNDNYEYTFHSGEINNSQCELVLPEIDYAVDASQEKMKWIDYGTSLVENVQYLSAMICFDNVLTLDPRLLLGLYNKGYCYIQLGRYQEAIECYDNIFRMDREYYGKYNILRFKASALFYLNKFKEALVCFDDLLKNSGKPKYSPCYKGFIFLIQKDYESAERLFDQVLKDHTNFYLALLGKGLIYQVKYTNLQLAQLYLQQSKMNVENLEEEFEFYFIQAKVFSALGFLKEAELAFDKALVLRPDHIPVQQERAALNNCLLDPSESVIQLHR
jgi:WD40 repeat protein